MNEYIGDIEVTQFLTSERILTFARAALTLVVGLVLARVVRNVLSKTLRSRMGAQEAMLIRRLVYYTLLALVILTVLRQLGFQLGVLLGAAGIATFAIGFAAQASVSNLISGLFLIAERPFIVGDLLEVDGKRGWVVSIDLLSVNLRTFDNLMLRVPNEALIKSTFVNLTRFPIRRIDIEVSVAYKEDTAKVREIMFEVANRNPLCLDEPIPRFIYKGYGDSGLELQFSVWAKRENFLQLMNSVREEIKAAFDEVGIEIPFPHRTLYTGSVTEPFPVRMVSDT